VHALTPNQRMNSDATLALRAKTGCAGYAGTYRAKELVKVEKGF